MTVHLVTGPPCGGKSRYVDVCILGPGEHRVVCWDTTARAMGLPTHPTPYRAYRQIMDVWAAALASGLLWEDADTARQLWVIRTLPTPDARARFLDLLPPTTHVVECIEPRDVLVARAAARPKPARTIRDIDAWLAAWDAPPPAVF